MLSLQQAVLASWSFPPWVTALNVLAALLYVRGWLLLRRVMPARFEPWRLISFLSGIAVLQIALASPIDAFDSFFLADHMVQHEMLMMVVPPLVLLGNPMIPLLRGLPRWIARKVLAPFLGWSPIARLGRTITRPAFCWLIFSISLAAWHFPGPYDLALRSDVWHDAEHASFLFTSILFWWPVVLPWPSRPYWPRWTVPVYLLLGGFVNTVISAFLVFSGRPLYAAYLTIPRIGSMSALNDQVLAGVVMWFVGSIAFLIPAVVLTVKLLSPQPASAPARRGPWAPESRFRRVVLPALALILPLAALAYGYLAPSSVDIDGNVVRVQQDSGPFRISVFTEPDPLPAGSCNVSVLVQDRSTGEPILDVPVSLTIQQPNTLGDIPTVVPASAAPSGLKLLESGTVILPHQGDWILRVAVRRGSSEGVVHGTLNATARE